MTECPGWTSSIRGTPFLPDRGMLPMYKLLRRITDSFLEVLMIVCMVFMAVMTLTVS